ncbi:MAG TPA: rhodanese-like domain-containing protein [Thermodesulfobacteriota bacterium]|nr:rhodanese-like domain-containing protein [Thermodesulfobacteriota bacterium]
MLWKRLFLPVQTMEPDELREYIAEHREGTYRLVDVRQPSEYEERHIPGALLIPLPELANRLPELNPPKPIIVY